LSTTISTWRPLVSGKPCHAPAERGGQQALQHGRGYERTHKLLIYIAYDHELRIMCKVLCQLEPGYVHDRGTYQAQLGQGWGGENLFV
jgi:hypothetical protein